MKEVDFFHLTWLELGAILVGEGSSELILVAASQDSVILRDVHSGEDIVDEDLTALGRGVEVRDAPIRRAHDIGRVVELMEANEKFIKVGGLLDLTLVVGLTNGGHGDLLVRVENVLELVKNFAGGKIEESLLG